MKPAKSEAVLHSSHAEKPNPEGTATGSVKSKSKMDDVREKLLINKKLKFNVIKSE